MRKLLKVGVLILLIPPILFIGEVGRRVISEELSKRTNPYQTENYLSADREVEKFKRENPTATETEMYRVYSGALKASLNRGPANE